MNLDWLNDVGQILPSLVGLAAKATAAMTLATVAVLLMRRAPAGARHCVLAAALTLVLLMPLLSTVLPSLNVRTRWRPLAKVDVQTAVQPQSDTAQATVISPAIPAASEGNTRIAVIPRFGRKPVDDAVAIPPPAPTRPSPLRLNWRTWLAWLWIAGVAVALAPLIASRVALAGLARRCTETEEARLTSLLRTLSARLKLNRRVRLLVHTDVSMPMTWGVLRPVILLPRASLRWPDDRRRIVLLHELAHVKWLDCLWLLVAKLARAVHWFNPLAWWCVARLRTEAERACDERVLNAGESAPEYAEQLLRTVASLGRGSASDVLVLGMARRSTLETRLRSILDRPPVARVLTPRRAAALVAMLALLLVPMSMLHLAAQTQPSPQKVLVRIVSTQGLPRASAYVSDKLTMQNATTTDADGRCQITAETSSTWFAYWPGMTSCAVFRIPKSPGHQPLTIKLDSSVGICYQRVTDGQGHGARGVGVTARVTLPDGASIETPRQFTDAAGYCEFALIPMVQGISIQSAVMTSGNTSNQWSQPTRLSSHRREIYLPDLAKQDIASPAEKPAWVGIGGTVRGQDGNSVADADVEIIFKTPPELGIRHRQAVTDPSGRWTTLIPHDAEVTHLQISHPRFVIESGSIGSWGPSPDQLRAGMAVTVLHHGVPLDGIVRDENGSPVPDVLIITRLEMSVGMSGPTQDPSMGRTGSDGKFRIESMDAGPHRLSTFSNDYLTSTADINLQPGTKPVEFKISKGGSVTGVVLDQQGKSVAGARVSASATTPRSSGGAPSRAATP